MNVIIATGASAEEIAALALAVQERQPIDNVLVNEVAEKMFSHLEEAYRQCDTQ